MAAYGNYTAVPRNGGCVISTANPNRDGSGTLGTVLTGATRATGANPPLQGGSRIDQLTIQATGTTTAGMVRLFLHDGTNARLLGEIQVPPITPNATTRAFSARLSKDSSDLLPIVLADGWSLRASTEKAETFNVLPTMAGDF